MARGAIARSSRGERVGVREWCSWPQTFAKTVRGRAPARFWLSMRASYGDVASCVERVPRGACDVKRRCPRERPLRSRRDRKSTRLNSSHSQISYAVFCLKKKKADVREVA